MNSKGILIIACGHQFYGRMALNLAASIKAVEPTMPIALRWAGNALNHLSLYNLSDLFESVEEIPQEYYLHQGKYKWIRTKVFMYDLSPFDETVFIDADTVWIPKRKPSELFKELQHVDITFANYARHDLNTVAPGVKVWANIQEVKEAYHFENGYYYCLQSEMVYFKKNESNMRFFEVAKQVYDNPKVKVADFAGGIPDEFAFSVAMLMTGIEPHTTPYYPTYWQPIHKQVKRETLADRHYLLSVGGAFQSDYIKNLYNAYAGNAFKKLRLETPFKYINKRSWLPERKSI